jgi:hypothetical protein
VRGIYRLADWPDRPGDDLILWHLWSGGQTVVSHLSAAEQWGLGQIEADRPHLTVPRTFRRALPARPAPAPLLYRRDLNWPRDITFSNHGFRVTTVPRTIIDIAPMVDPDHLAIALKDAFSRGSLSAELLDHWMREAAPEAAATIRRAQAELGEGNGTPR